MPKILAELFMFLVAVFGHWQTWLSGGGIGGFVVISEAALSRIFNFKLTTRQYVHLFLVTFFLGSCFLAWVDKNEDNRALAEANARAHAEDIRLLKTTQNDYGSLQYTCNYQSGVTDTLRKQNGDQQSTINNCQTQALSLLSPPPLSIQTVGYGIRGTPSSILILSGLTNKTISPVDAILTCSSDVEIAGDGKGYERGPSIGGEMAQQGAYAKKVSPGVIKVHITEPAWTPIHPLQISVVTTDENVVCKFTRK